MPCCRIARLESGAHFAWSYASTILAGISSYMFLKATDALFAQAAPPTMMPAK